MAKILLLEPIGGIAGDMFVAAALDLGVPRAAVDGALAGLHLPGFRLMATPAEAGGIAGTHVDVLVEGAPGPGRGLAEILAIVDGSALPPRARGAARAVFERIGRAEARVHGLPVERVHFHEVGAVDSIVDVCAAAAVLQILGWPRVLCAPPELGQGFVNAAHGRLPVPPPAVVEILKGIPVRPGGPQGEAVTPTGAALLAVLAEVADPSTFPALVAGQVGYGVGTARWSDRPNVLRMTLGEEAERGGLWVIEANLDDCPGQLVARAIEAALAAGDRREAVARVFLDETTTLGVRLHAVERIELERELVSVRTAYGEVRVKVGRRGDAVVGAHPEYDDCLARAREHGVAVREVLAAALTAFRSGG
jgi:hypothetical protein